MSSLIKQAQGKLNKAGDAARDPADLSADAPGSDTASVTDSSEGSDSAVVYASGNAGVSASASDGEIADASADVDDSDTAGEAASTTDSRIASKAGSSKSSNKAGSTAGRVTSKTTSGGNKKPGGTKKPAGAATKGRRVGRPAGPARTALTVRVLTEIDEALTNAVDDTGLSPQYIADEALHAWLTQRGYIAGGQNGAGEVA